METGIHCKMDLQLVHELPPGHAEIPPILSGRRAFRMPHAIACALQIQWENTVMKAHYAVAMAIAGFGLGAAAVQGLHAQARPPIYQITEIDVPRDNVDAYLKEYAPKAQAIIKAHGGRSLAATQNVTAVEGDAPKSRVAITVWDSPEKFNAYRNAADFKDLRASVGNKLAKYRSFTVEGNAQ
jgi:uncharacterized protein (DUF1330 family)